MGPFLDLRQKPRPGSGIGWQHCHPGVPVMKYEDPACAYCPPTVRACRQGESEARGPGFCPTKVDPEVQALARTLYDEPELRKISRESAVVESQGYCKWTRVEEIVQFAKRMG